MIVSWARPFRVEGGLVVDTHVDGPGSPIAIRSVIQVDCDLYTLVDPDRGGTDPVTLGRHSIALRHAFEPMLRTLTRIHYAIAPIALVPVGAWIWYRWDDRDPLHMIGATCVALVLRWLTQRACVRLLQLLVKRGFERLVTAE